MTKKAIETKVLNMLGIADFRHLTKDNVTGCISSLFKMDPEMQKIALEHFPDFALAMRELISEYDSAVKQALESNSASTALYYKACSQIISTLTVQLDKSDYTNTEKLEIMSLMLQLEGRMSAKDTENKAFVRDCMRYASSLVAMVLLGSLALLGVKSGVKLPKPF